ncbi:MAG: hypothetical protein IH608_13670 [Proteobacteria bacterium]|nr:hypothetical protein [Pseudomonadota bacterium]
MTDVGLIPGGETRVGDNGGLLRLLATVEGMEPRQALWVEHLAARSPAEGAQTLDQAVRKAALREADAVSAYLALLDLPTVSARVGAGRMAEILAAAREASREGCLLLLEHPGPPVAREGLGPPPDPVLETVSLGHRKTAARGPRSTLLERILRDPDPRVVGEVLRNPRLREGEILAVASRRPCPQEIFWLLVRRGSWLLRPAVQRAVVLNPYAPPQLAVALVPLLMDPDLVALAQQEGLHPAVRDGALDVLSWRRAVGP